jgi:uncharacterized protein (DUF305 family)
MPTPNPTIAALSRLSGQPFDIAFMRELIPIDEEAVEIANSATLYADHPELLQWNQRLIDRKTSQVDLMLSVLKQMNVSPGRRMVTVVSDPVKLMRSLRGAALEKAYIPLMIVHMGRSLELGKLAAVKASHPDLRNLAEHLVKTETQEIVMLRAWMTKWYGQ